jgi:hypothetical protein
MLRVLKPEVWASCSAVGTGLVQIDHGLQLVSGEVTTHTLRASTDRTDHDLRPLNQQGLVLMLTRQVHHCP